MDAKGITTLRAAFGNYPHTKALRTKEVTSPTVQLDLVEIAPVYKAFGEMVRKQAFDAMTALASRDAMAAAFKASGAKLACLVLIPTRSIRGRPPTPPRRWPTSARRISIWQDGRRTPIRSKRPASEHSSSRAATHWRR